MKILLKIVATIAFIVVLIVGFNIVTADTSSASDPGHAYYDDGDLCPDPGDSCAVVCSPSPCEHEHPEEN